MNRKILLAAAAALVPMGAAAEPMAFTMDPNHSTIHANWTHSTGTPLLIAFPVFESEIMFDPEDIASSSVSVTIDTAAVWTGSELWDDHLTGDERPLLRSAEYPTATFVSTGVTPTGDDTATLTGDLTIKDQTHEVSFDVELKGEAMGRAGEPIYGFLATTTVDRTLFGLDMAADIFGPDLMITVSSEIVGPAPEAE